MNVDLVVVGGGILGTFHAYHAALMGKKVILTEKDQYPVSATVRNFGQIVPSGMTEQWLRYGQRSTEIYKSIQQEFDISVRQNGSVYVASDPDERLLLHELQALMDTQGYEAQLLSQAQTLSKYPALRADYCREALFFPNDMSAEPERLIYRIHEYMLGKFPNFTYRPHTAVIACEVVGSHVEVTTAQREVLVAEKVIVCNGGEFKLLFADLFRQNARNSRQSTARRKRSLCDVHAAKLARKSSRIRIESNLCLGSANESRRGFQRRLVERLGTLLHQGRPAGRTTAAMDRV